MGPHPETLFPCIDFTIDLIQQVRIYIKKTDLNKKYKRIGGIELLWIK